MMVNVECSTFLFYVGKQWFLFLVLRDTNDQICVSIDEEIEATVIIDPSLPDIGSLLILLRPNRGYGGLVQKEAVAKAISTLYLRVR
jgi:hypothetical protein